jgi:hypothetical protein
MVARLARDVVVADAVTHRGAGDIRVKHDGLAQSVCFEWTVGTDRIDNTFGRQAHSSDVSAFAEGNSLLSTIAPITPTPVSLRLSSVMLFSRSEARGIPQKSVIVACSSTTVARWLAASPVIPQRPTLRHTQGQEMSER